MSVPGAGTGLPHNARVDRDRLHAYLFRQTNRYGKIKLVQKHLADELGITNYTLSRIMKEFLEDGRAKLLSRGKHDGNAYMIVDPAVWAANQEDAAHS
jgi:hypothetical protein